LSPRSQNSEDKSQSSNESFYERQLSVAFDEGEAFRDSAVYCEMDPDQAVLKSEIKLPVPNRVILSQHLLVDCYSCNSLYGGFQVFV
jgi:hypothetical protein